MNSLEIKAGRHRVFEFFCSEPGCEFNAAWSGTHIDVLLVAVVLCRKLAGSLDAASVCFRLVPFHPWTVGFS